MTVALYGHYRGENSFVQVTRGMQRALIRNDALDSTCSVESDGGGGGGFAMGAPVSLNCGNPNALLLAHRLGAHREHWLLLAPNGERLPERFAESLTTPSEICPRGLLDGGLLAPSKWAAGVLARYFDRPIVVAPHGVNPDVHYVRRAQRARAIDDYAAGLFYCVHLTSGETERKGTRELFAAWAMLKRQQKLPDRAVLVTVGPSQELSRLRSMAHMARLRDEDLLIAPGFGLDPAGVVETYYAPAHLVCQPSRGEGFGLVPLEARACGVPIAATAVTGHSEHLPAEGAPGAVVVETGELAPMDDFSGSMAPTVTADAIAAAIAEAYDGWVMLDAAACAASAAVQHGFAWERVCRPAIQKLKERGTHVRDTDR